MSVNRNPDGLENAGEFHAKVPRSEPLTTKGHKPGVAVGNDARPEFHAQTLPAGSAPPEHSFAPQPTSEVPGQALNPDIPENLRTDANDTLGGTDSAAVHTGLGKPVQGQSSQQLHGDGSEKGRKGDGGLGNLGSGPQKFTGELNEKDYQHPNDQSAKLRTHREPGSAEEREPASAEEVASEFPG